MPPKQQHPGTNWHRGVIFKLTSVCLLVDFHIVDIPTGSDVTVVIRQEGKLNNHWHTAGIRWEADTEWGPNRQLDH